MSVLNSLNDGVVSNEADKEFIQKQIEPTPSETDSQTEKEEGRDESERETEKESEVTSNVRVKAAVGVVKLLLHSSAGELASISVEGWAVWAWSMLVLVLYAHVVPPYLLE